MSRSSLRSGLPSTEYKLCKYCRWEKVNNSVRYYDNKPWPKAAGLELCDTQYPATIGFHRDDQEAESGFNNNCLSTVFRIRLVYCNCTNLNQTLIPFSCWAIFSVQFCYHLNVKFACPCIILQYFRKIIIHMFVRFLNENGRVPACFGIVYG